MITQFKTWYARRKVYRQTIKELQSLSSHELRDLGITADMIPEIAAEATYGERR
jgi:uncharacterized protein YjiS (DUF1127 family)